MQRPPRSRFPLFLLPLLAAACLTLSCKTPPQFNTLVDGAATLDDTVVQLANSALLSQSITSAQAQKVLDITNAVKNTLVTAEAAYTAGNTAVANAQLAAATAKLTTAQGCVQAPNAKATLDTCLKGAL